MKWIFSGRTNEQNEINDAFTNSQLKRLQSELDLKRKSEERYQQEADKIQREIADHRIKKPLKKLLKDSLQKASERFSDDELTEFIQAEIPSIGSSVVTPKVTKRRSLVSNIGKASGKDVRQDEKKVTNPSDKSGEDKRAFALIYPQLPEVSGTYGASGRLADFRGTSKLQSNSSAMNPNLPPREPLSTNYAVDLYAKGRSVNRSGTPHRQSLPYVQANSYTNSAMFGRGMQGGGNGLSDRKRSRPREDCDMIVSDSRTPKRMNRAETMETLQRSSECIAEMKRFAKRRPTISANSAAAGTWRPNYFQNRPPV